MLNGHLSRAEAIADYDAAIQRMAPGTTWRGQHRLTAGGARMGTKPEYDHEQLEIESQARQAAATATMSASQPGPVPGGALDKILALASDQQGMLKLSQADSLAADVIGAIAEVAAEAQRQLELAASAGEPYGDVAYADPGYRDGKKRYPVDTGEHVRAAWAYISKEHNASFYSASQLRSIKNKIRAAARKFGIQIADDGGQDHVRTSGQLGSVVTGGGAYGGSGDVGSGFTASEVKLSGPLTRDSVYAEYFGDQADEARDWVDRAEAGEEEEPDPSIDHDAEVARFRELAGDTAFVQGHVPPPGMRSVSRTYGANITYPPKSLAARNAAEARETAGRRQNRITT